MYFFFVFTSSPPINSAKLRSETAAAKSALPVSQLEFADCFETHFPIEFRAGCDCAVHRQREENKSIIIVEA